jgi:hypothetical protein
VEHRKRRNADDKESRRWLAGAVVCLDGKKLAGAIVKTGNTAGILYRH